MLNILIDIDGGGTFISETIPNGLVIGLAVFAVALYVAFYLLRSFGLYKIAKNQGIEKAYLSFIPAVWMFVACKIIGNASVFGVSAEKSAVWVTVVFSCAVFLPIISGFLEYFPYAMYYLQGGTLTITSESSVPLTGSDFQNLFDTNAINIILRIISIINVFLNLAEIFLLITVYIALFKMYWTEHYILGAVLSFFGLFPIIIFAVRNRKPVDFNEYIRQRYYGSGYTPYGNNYYNNQANSQFNNQPDNNNNSDPFDEFSNRPEDPFGEFADESKSNTQSDNKDDFFS